MYNFQKWLSNNFSIIFYILVFLLFFPSFTIVTLGNLNVFSHHVITILIPIIFLIQLFVYKRKIFKHTLFFFILFFFFSQSISIITAINPFQFLVYYKNLVVSVCIFFTLLFLLDRPKQLRNLHSIAMISLLLWISLHLLMYFVPNDITIISNIFHDKYKGLWEAHLINKKFFFETHFVSFLPLVFLYFIKEKNMGDKSMYFFFILSLTFLSYVSNFRITFLVYASTLIVSCIMYRSYNMIKLNFKSIVIIIFVFTILIIGDRSSIQKVNITVVDRFLLSEEAARQTLVTRSTLIKEAIKIGFINPIIGVGLGNYYDYLPLQKTNSPAFNSTDKILLEGSYRDPHNIFLKTFAETGIIGLLSLITLITYFFIYDIKNLKSRNILLSCYIVAFWSHFSYALFNPSFSLTYLSFFWFLRAIILKLSIEKWNFELLYKEQN